MTTIRAEAMRPCDFSELADGAELWRDWGFVPWSYEGMAGVSRRVTFTKGGLLGEVARYYADDYIVWMHGGPPAVHGLFATWPPVREVMLHRFVFVVDHVVRPPRQRSFWFGFKGYLEVYEYAVGGRAPRRVGDLTPLVEQCWRDVRGNAGR